MKKYIKPELLENIYLSNESMTLSGKFAADIYSDNDEKIDWTQLFK